MRQTPARMANRRVENGLGMSNRQRKSEGCKDRQSLVNRPDEAARRANNTVREAKQGDDKDSQRDVKQP